MTNSGSNSFTSPITVSQGILAVNGDNDLGGQPVILGSQWRNRPPLPHSGTTNADIRLAAGTGATASPWRRPRVPPLTVNQPFDLTLSGSANVVHDDAPGNLILNAGNPDWTGRLYRTTAASCSSTARTTPQSLGTLTVNAVASNNPGGAFQFLPGQTIAKPFTVNNTGINNGGALESVVTALPGGPSWSGVGATTLCRLDQPGQRHAARGRCRHRLELHRRHQRGTGPDAGHRAARSTSP